MRTGRLSPFVLFDTAKDTWACWDGSQGYSEYQVDYDRRVAIHDPQAGPIIDYYPECNYNTHAYRYLSVEVSDYNIGDSVTLELRLVKSDFMLGTSEVVDWRYDTWILRI